MAANFNIAKSIFLNAEELATLLSDLKPARFAFSVINCLVAEEKSNKVGSITGFSSLKASSTDQSALVLLQSTSPDQSVIVETDLAVVVDFGDYKQTLRLGALQRTGTLSQHEHGLFIQRCSVAQQHVGNGSNSSAAVSSLVPDAERVIEIRNRIAHGREKTINDSSSSSSCSFATWKILDGDALKNKLSGMRRERENDEFNNNNNNRSEEENNKMKNLVDRFQDNRVSRLQGQLSEQLAALSQARNEVRSLQNEVQSLQTQLKNTSANNTAAANNQQQQQSTSSASSSSADQQQKLLTVITSLTTKVSQLNSQIDELVCAAAAKFSVEPTVEAVLEAMQ